MTEAKTGKATKTPPAKPEPEERAADRKRELDETELNEASGGKSTWGDGTIR
ncbi:MAG TPA: hypothetical protein VFA12_13540 [Stellaceae bacterium]|nr:hypothetical protein [Stellaceae bacterium]